MEEIIIQFGGLLILGLFLYTLLAAIIIKLKYGKLNEKNYEKLEKAIKKWWYKQLGGLRK